MMQCPVSSPSRAVSARQPLRDTSAHAEQQAALTWPGQKTPASPNLSIPRLRSVLAIFHAVFTQQTVCCVHFY